MKQLPLFIFSVLLALGAGGGYVFMLSTIQGAVDEIATAHADSQASEEREKNAQSANVFMAETADARAELSTFVTTDADFVSAIDLIEAAGKREKADVTIGSVSVKKTTAKSHEIAVVILSAKGSFSALTAFVSSLESLPLASRVTSVSLEASADNSWFETVTVEFVKRKSP